MDRRTVTAEMSRSRIWQSLRHAAVSLHHEPPPVFTLRALPLLDRGAA